MNVSCITDMSEILKLVPMETEIMAKEPKRGAMSIKDKLTWIDAMLNRKQFVTLHDFKVFAWYTDEDEIAGYIIASITKTKIKYFDELRVYRIWHDPKHPELVDEGVRLLEDWAKQNKVTVIRSEANRRIRAFHRRFKMEPLSVNMERRLA